MGILVESRPRQLLTTMPLIYMKAVVVQKDWDPQAVGFIRPEKDIYNWYVTTIVIQLTLFLQRIYLTLYFFWSSNEIVHATRQHSEEIRLSSLRHSKPKKEQKSGFRLAWLWYFKQMTKQGCVEKNSY